MGYIRRFRTDPGPSTLAEIEAVNILDVEPPAQISGVGTGVVLVFGEFENGPFATLTEIGSGTDLLNTFGGLGFGTSCAYPCAVSRTPDLITGVEYWNGNGYVSLYGKTFAKLVISRVDTSVGSVQLTRRACLLGTSRPSYAIANSQVLTAKIDGGGAATATFTSAAATVTGTGGDFSPTAGGYCVLGWDSDPDVTVIFYSGDDTLGECVSRINTAAGFTFASTSGGQIKLTGRKSGTSAAVRVVSGSTGCLTHLGLTAATTIGTGNVADASAVTPAEVTSIVQAAITGSAMNFKSDGTPRLESTTAGTGSVEVTACTATDLGFTAATDSATTVGTAGVIPAGTIVKTSAPIRFVTMQDVNVTAASAGPYTVKIRHATDDGTGLTAAASSIVLFDSVIDLDAFSVTNTVTASAALTEAQIDAAYATTIAAANDVNTIARDVNVTYSARESNAVRRALRSNAIDASANGCNGRIACIAPPVGTSKANAKSAVEPGNGAYRTDYVVYNFPGAQVYIPAIARVGVSGGTGFTSTGLVNVHSDGFCASLMSQIAPEQNIGQTTDLLSAVIGLESSSTAQGLGISDYTSFKAAGICALRMDDGVAVFQSAVVNVDPLVNPSLKNIARRRFADYLEDSMARRLSHYSKMPNTLRRRQGVKTEMDDFLLPMKGLTNPESQRIDDYQVDITSGNTPTSIASGEFRVVVYVQMVSSMETIVLQAVIGESVVVKAS